MDNVLITVVDGNQQAQTFAAVDERYAKIWSSGMRISNTGSTTSPVLKICPCPGAV